MKFLESNIVISVFTIAFFAITIQPALSQEIQIPEDIEKPIAARFGGPDSVADQLADDARSKNSLTGHSFLRDYNDRKKLLYEETGIKYTLDYTISTIFPTNTMSGEHTFASGAVRFYGSWDLIGRDTGNTGSFIWKVENRHRIIERPASDSASDIGYIGGISGVHSNDGNRLTNLYWKQNLFDNRLEVVFGMLDATDWMDVYPLASPWTGFTNFNFGTGTAALPIPDDAAIGAFVNAMITDNLYVVSGIVDANASSTDPFNGFDTFFNDKEFFKVIELGWTSSQDRFYLDNTHLTLWHADERTEFGSPSGWGANFSITHSFLGDTFLPFLRVGYADDSGALLQKSVSTGFGYHFGDDTNLLGLGLHWGQPNEKTFGPGLSDQYAAELFTRIQLTENIQVTPNFQYIINPALNTGAKDSFVFGLRTRAVF
jgi:porin